ncbi:threonine synthase [Candidatus Woesearchaeota archaeon]|nr:threonine synthase [Candidatus Woesearchaeota archaeon]
MKFYSTNNKNLRVNIKQALFLGQAPDKGLFMPEKIPKISENTICSFKNMKYPEIAFDVLKKFFKDISENYLRRISKDAYNFSIPVEEVDSKYILRLDQGPTASFKDFAARMMAGLFDYYLAEDNKKLLILVATSGDTGSAAADAFFGKENIDVCILFPKNEVSVRQRKQMTTLGKNIFPVLVSGKFDDCQDFVKKAFSDPDLKSINLSSANSINIGRLLPQSVYYFYAYSRIADFPEKVVFSVPSGNFGDLMGGVIAKEMGLPVDRFIAAVNENDEFERFLKSGTYEKLSPSRECMSNAMNVGHPSNLARLIDLYGGNMDEKGNIKKMPDMKKMREDFFSVSVSDEQTIKTIKNAYEKHALVLEPHGAVAWRGAEVFKTKNKTIVFETAHPAKFPEILKQFNIGIKVPESIALILDKRESYETIQNYYGSFKRLLAGKYL